MASYKIGIDIGGTRTHAVLVDGNTILATVDVATTDDTKEGVVNAINALLNPDNTHLAIKRDQIAAVMIGTTHFVNRVLQKNGLNTVMAVRLGAPLTTSIMPALDWPESLHDLIGYHSAIVRGGYEYDNTEIAPIDEEEIRNLATKARGQGISCIAISGVFSILNPQQEFHVAKIFNSVAPGFFRISFSHQIGTLGLLARENATILNAALSEPFDEFRDAIAQALEKTQLTNAQYLLSSNSGTLENPSEIFPVQTYASGPSNSICGAATLIASKLRRAIVVDVGGTSTDVGINKDGIPLQAGIETLIGDEKEGFCVNFWSPWTVSGALGGGSIIDEINNIVTVGPKSVGYRLQTEAIVFGGTILTVTDIAVAKRRLNLGDRSLLDKISPALLDKADDIFHTKLTELINRAVPHVDTDEEITVVLVGGGAVLFDIKKLQPSLHPKINLILVPEHAPSANAIGASIARVNAQVSEVVSYEDVPGAMGTARDRAVEMLSKKAEAKAKSKGADPKTLVRHGVTSEVPFNYLPGALNLLTVQVIGDYLPSLKPNSYSLPRTQNRSEEKKTQVNRPIKPQTPAEVKLKNMAAGAALLGSGGGGGTYNARLMVQQYLQEGKAPKLMELSELSDNDNVVCFAMFGAPTVVAERIPSQHELSDVFTAAQRELGEPITAVCKPEIGGLNGVMPDAIAAENKVPVLNADGMGRAFPAMPMTSISIHATTEAEQKQLARFAILANGREVRTLSADNVSELDTKVRLAVGAMGGAVTFASFPMKGKQAKEWCVPRSVSVCEQLGSALRSANMNTLLAEMNAACNQTEYGPVRSIGSGRITQLKRDCKNVQNIGYVTIEAAGEAIRIDFINENLRAINLTTGATLAVVPDIITLLDNEGAPIPCEYLRVGLEISKVLAIGVPKILKTDAALKVVGPAAFNFPEISHVRSVPGITFQPLPRMPIAVPDLQVEDNRLGVAVIK